MTRTFALALAMGLSTGALATPLVSPGLQHRGTPAVDSTALSTYGIEVPVRTALRGLIPTGWRLFVHKSAALPSALSWKPGDTWTQVLHQAAAAQSLSVLLDWDTRTVMVRPLEVALQEGAIRAEVAQAASTPLPRFDEKPSAAPAVPAQSLAHKAVASAQAPAESLAPAVSPALQEAVASAPLTSLEKVQEPAPEVVASSASRELEPQPLPKADNVASASDLALDTPELAADTSTVTADTGGVAGAQESLPLVPSATEVLALSPNEELVPSAPAPVALESAAAPAEQAPVLAQPYRYEADGSLTAPNALVALAAAAERSAVAPEQEPGPAAVATLAAFQGLANNPASVAQGLLAPGTVQWGRPSTAREGTVVADPLGAAKAFFEPQPAEPATAPLALASAVPAQAPPAPPPAPAPAAAAAADIIAVSPVLAPADQIAAPAVQVELPSVPVFLVNPTAELVAQRDQAAADKPAVQLKSTNDFSYAKSVALNKPAVRTVAQGLANRFDLRLVWVAPEFRLEGPITLLAQSATQDVELLRKALGRFAPVTVTVEGAELRVVSKDPAFVARHHALAREEAARQAAAKLVQPPKAAPLPAQAVDASAPVPAASAVPTASTQTSGPLKSLAAGAFEQNKVASVVASETLASARAFELVIEPGDTLEQSLRRLLQTRGYTHEWKVDGGFEATRRLSFQADTLSQLLSEVLPPLGISADIYTVDNHIVIRPGDYRE